MHRLAMTAALALAVTAGSSVVTPADAAKAKAKAAQARYCARYLGGAESCGFSTMQQCLQALSGNGGMCVAVQEMPRPKKLAPVTPLTPRDEDDTED